MANSWKMLRASQAASERRPAAGLFKHRRLLLERRKRLEKLQGSTRRTALIRRNLWLSRGMPDQSRVSEDPPHTQAVDASELPSEGAQGDKRPAEDPVDKSQPRKKMRQTTLFSHLP